MPIRCEYRERRASIIASPSFEGENKQRRNAVGRLFARVLLLSHRQEQRHLYPLCDMARSRVVT